MWNAIESVPGQVAPAKVWRNLLRDSFAQASHFLSPLDDLPAHVRCCRCSCSHRLVHIGADNFIAICECENFQCTDISLTREDIVLLEFDWIRLGRSAVRALDCAPRECDLDFYCTRQFAAFGDAVPVLFTIQHDAFSFAAAITHLVARLNGPFILLAPTAQFIDAAAHQLLNSRRAGFFALDTFLRVDGRGHLCATRTAGELFARFAPQPAPHDSTVAEQAIALLAKLENTQPRHSPSVFSVFLMYCTENLTAQQIADRSHCSKATVVNRLKTIRRVTGMPPEDLRRFSPHLDHLRDTHYDPRARAQRLGLR